MISVLKNSKLFQGLTASELEQVCHTVMPAEKEYSKNQIIINQGESVHKIGILKKGTAISTKYHFNGDMQILRIYNQGEAFSLDTVNTTLLTSPVTLISQTDSTVVFFPYAKLFETSAIYAGTKEIILSNCSEMLSNELIRLMYKIDVLSKRTLHERILTYLSLIRERSGCGTFDIGMNQEQFARYLCVNRSVLCKELNRMRNAGIVTYKGSLFTIL
ncbi:MAG: Crp/Fnr family transcriptional regulator [Eubacteriales bacterium]|nr:Crp/Fnr family transcriptional regulator [Eubacteriales bacterium]